MQRIRLALGGLPHCRIFRNSVGAVEDKFGNFIRYGLAKGSSDLIGWRTVKITTAMVGRPLAVFVAVEVKTPDGYTDKERLAQQTDFVETVQRAGGLAGFADSPATALRIINGI